MVRRWPNGDQNKVSEIPNSHPTQSHNALLLSYLAPTGLFILFTLLEGSLPKPDYPFVYMAKIAVVTAALCIFRTPLKDYRWQPRAVLPALVVGLIVYLFWIPLDRATPFHFPLGQRSAFDPYLFLPDPLKRNLFLILRFYGLVIMVPIMEELFWRSFLLRLFTAPDKDFLQLPLEGFSNTALLLGSGLFALAHPEWLSAFLCGLLYALLLRYTRTLTAPLIAHILTNLLLGLYILHTHNWSYW
jgi:CAAX prenyl protease-like protein